MKHLEDSEHAAPYGRMGEEGEEPPSIDASGTTVKTLRRNDSHYTATYDPKVTQMVLETRPQTRNTSDPPLY
jgi:hypothetical protein